MITLHKSKNEVVISGPTLNLPVFDKIILQCLISFGTRGGKAALHQRRQTLQSFLGLHSEEECVVQSELRRGAVRLRELGIFKQLQGEREDSFAVACQLQVRTAQTGLVSV